MQLLVGPVALQALLLLPPLGMALTEALPTTEAPLMAAAVVVAVVVAGAALVVMVVLGADRHRQGVRDREANQGKVGSRCSSGLSGTTGMLSRRRHRLGKAGARGSAGKGRERGSGGSGGEIGRE